MPERVQLRRSAGWRMPPNTVKVDRSTRWGNPFRSSDYPRVAHPEGCEEPVRVSREERNRWAASDFKAMICYGIGSRRYPSDAEIREVLAGKNLACWCPPGQPCHADVLLDVANR